MASEPIRPETIAEAQNFERELSRERGELQVRLLEAVQDARTAFFIACMPETRTRLQTKRAYEACTAKAEVLRDQLMELLAQHVRLTGVLLDPRLPPLAPPPDAVLPEIDTFSRMLNNEILAFQARFEALRMKYQTRTIQMCQARAEERGEILVDMTACYRQMRRLDEHIDRLKRLTIDEPQPRDPRVMPRPTFVFPEQRYQFKITRNAYPDQYLHFKVMPLLQKLIQTDPQLKDLACVPAGFGSKIPLATEQAIRAAELGAPLRFANQVGNLTVQKEGKQTILDVDPDEVSRGLQGCAGQRFTLLLLGGLGHQNALLMDNVERTVERIEPHGGIGEPVSNIKFEVLARRFVEQMLNTLGLGLYVYVPARMACPVLGPQALEEKSQRAQAGHCVAWSALLLLARILNPAYTTLEVQEKMLEGRSPKYLKDLIRAFIQFADTVVGQMTFEIPDYDAFTPKNRSASPDEPFRGY